MGRTSLWTSRQKLRSGPPNPGKTSISERDIPTRTSMKKLRSEKLRADFSVPTFEVLKNTLTLQPLLFWKKQGFFPKKARVLLFAEPLKSLEKRGKTHKKAREIGKRKKQGNQKKQGLEGQGSPKIFLGGVVIISPACLHGIACIGRMTCGGRRTGSMPSPRTSLPLENENGETTARPPCTLAMLRKIPAATNQWGKLFSEVSKRGWRDGVGDKHTPKNSPKEAPVMCRRSPKGA